MSYTTIKMPSGIPVSAIRDFADRLGLQVRTNGCQLILVDPTLPTNIRKLPARKVTSPELGGAA